MAASPHYLNFGLLRRKRWRIWVHGGGGGGSHPTREVQSPTTHPKRGGMEGGGAQWMVGLAAHGGSDSLARGVKGKAL